MAGISYVVCQKILMQNFNTHNTDMKFICQLLTLNQRKWHLDVFLEFYEMANDNTTFIPRNITVMGYDPETKYICPGGRVQSQRPKNVRQSGVQEKVCSLFWVFFNVKFTKTLFLLAVRWILTFTLMFKAPDRRHATKKKAGTVVKPQLVVASWQCVCSHFPQDQFLTESNIIPFILTCDFTISPQNESEAEGMLLQHCWWNPHDTASGTEKGLPW